LVDACGESPGWLCEEVFDASDGNATLSKLSDWLVSRPLTIAMIVIAAAVAAWLTRRYFSRVIHRFIANRNQYAAQQLQRLGIDEPEALGGYGAAVRSEARASSITAVISSTATVIIWTIAMMSILEVLGVDLGPFLATAGIAGVALGFGAQSLVKDCISGLFMLLEDQYGIGDVVDLGEAIGVVEQVSLRTTVLRGVDGTVWHVPNGEVQRVGNRSQLWSMAVVDVSVAYETDLEEAKRIVLSTVESVCAEAEWSDTVLEPPTLLGVEELALDGITLRVTIKTAPGAQWALQRVMRERLKVELERAGVDSPFPQRTVWLRNQT
jgi:small conductance mechanosensitive channel